VPGALGARGRERERAYSRAYSPTMRLRRGTCRRWPTVTVITTGVPSFHSPRGYGGAARANEEEARRGIRRGTRNLIDYFNQY